MIVAISKRQKAINEKVAPGKIYESAEAFTLLKELSSVKFVESVDVAIQLGVDPKKSDQMIRGAMVLPKGTGKTVRVAVFAQGAQADVAKEAGADIIGFEDLAETIKKGEMDFDLLIATPNAMRLVGQLGRVLGPRGLMPNPKTGTVADDVATAVKNAKSGQIRYRTEKSGIVHCKLGNVSFSAEDLKANLIALLTEIKRVRPTAAKGIYMKRVTVSTTMGPGMQVNFAALDV
ncbi:MAG: 50S ribosomal protein L1 [Gammaproteobacteria bacterium]|nr:50S ribosomal protein L1 [Gammaproteobacteria bacterium]